MNILLNISVLCLLTVTVNAKSRNTFALNEKWVCNVKRSCVECLRLSQCSWCEAEKRCFSRDLPNYQGFCKNNSTEYQNHGLSFIENARCACAGGQLEENCVPEHDASGLKCSGRGQCLCGRCVCHSKPVTEHPTKCQEQIMPFKIVQTIEKQQPKLTIVPAYWECNGVLRLPKIGARKLVTNGDSRPLQGWVSMKCTVKRSSFQTYREAEEELTLMENKSDTDVPEYEGINLNSIQDTNYNSMAENLILLNRGTEEEIPAPRTSTSTAAAPGEIEYIISTSELPNTITDLQNVQIDTNIFEEILKNQNKILENQNVILQNQCVMQKMQQCVLNQEEINCKQISNLVVLVEDSFTRLRQQNKRETVVSLGDANAFEKESFYIKPLANVKELEELECKLSDNVEKSLLEQRFEFLCTRSAGKGINCAYKLLDIIFRRDFLCKCSWSGGSRGNATKIGLKGFKNVLSFFYNMVHSWDPLYTYEDNENFFKMVTKNATKRSEIKDLRASTKRKRQEVKESKNKKSKTETSQEAETVESSQENPNQEKEDREIENRENENQDIENQEIENRETENQEYGHQENNESENNEEESLC